MKAFPFPLQLVFVASVLTPTAELNAQSSQQLFPPLNVRLSQSGAGYGESQVIFNSNTLNVDCSSTQTPVAYLSSSASASPANSTENVLVDNNVNVTNLTNSNGPVNVCTGGVNGSQVGELLHEQLPGGCKRGKSDRTEPRHIRCIGRGSTAQYQRFAFSGAETAD